MYISKIEIDNFRCFKRSEIDFKEGLNIIIGHNNSGKSNLIKALSIFFDGTPKYLDIDDFNKNVDIEKIKEKPPKITISITIEESIDEEKYSDDLATIATWLVKLEKPYKAKLSYEFFLPEQENKVYKEVMEQVTSDDIEEYYRTIKHEFLRKYIYRIYCGDPEFKQTAESDNIKKFDFQFLNAIRDVERDLFTGKNTLLKEVLEFFMDYDIKSSQEKDEKEKRAEIKKKKENFSKDAKELIKGIQNRIKEGKDEMLKYAKDTGASFENVKLNFDGHIMDTELYSALKLMVEYETGIKIPATHNGLGYNNLIYISLLLAKMQKDASGQYLGSNVKVYPILAIEEPEAHLHPAMQYKFLKFLKENQKKEVRQIFITTHSPSITAAIELDDIICLHKNDDKTLNIGYPGKVFKNTDNDRKSKAYVQRFLDATKSDMLFAKAIIFVEGISEQLLISLFAKYLKKDLDDNHIAVINVGGRYFEHFLKLFDFNRTDSMHKRVAVITDVDPVLKKKSENSKFKKCFPFEIKENSANYEYKKCSNNLILNFPQAENIKVFFGEIGKSKTFEYDLILHNPECKILVANSMENAASIRVLMEFFKVNKTNVELLEFIKDDKIKTSINEAYDELWTRDEIKKNIIAAYYLSNITNKGEIAIEIADNLLDNLEKNEAKFKVPDYLKDAIEWICQLKS